MKKEELNIPIPENVLDAIAYRQLIKLQELPIMTKDKWFDCSDGKRVAVSQPKHTLINNIAHLPDEEQDAILAKSTNYRKISMKLAKLKARAYGRDNQPNKVTFKLDQRQNDLIELFSSMHSFKEVYEIVNHTWKLDVSQPDIKKFYDTHQDTIREKQEFYKTSVDGIRLGYKRSRLEERSWLYRKVKIQYNRTNKQGDAKLLIDILNSIQKETEGDVINITGNLDIKVEQNVNLHVKKYLMSQMILKEIILARVAARTGVDTKLLLFDLNSSYYKAISGVVDEPDFTQEITYPSQQAYDFDSIDKKRKKINEERDQIKKTAYTIDIPHEDIIEDEQLISEDKPAAALSIKDQLRQSLLKKMKKVDSDISKIDLDADVKKSEEGKRGKKPKQ